MDQFELLKQYKDLLDEGIISQEEFEEKKKGLLENPIVISADNKESATGQTQPGSSQAAQSTQSGLSTKATAILGYIGLIFWVIAFACGDKEGAKFHLNQALVINIAALFGVIPVVGWIWGIVVFIFWIMGLVGAIKGEENEVPLIGKIKLLN